MKIINESVQAELTEKKSKFICNLFYVVSEEEAKAKIAEIKKQYHDARHNCYAYRIAQENRIIENSSDDGEPSGTAGSPMLSILQGNDLVNVVSIVTRYFGGILLGTGGLVRAYSGSLEKAIQEAYIVQCELGVLAQIEIEYAEQSQFEYDCKQCNARIVKGDYLEKVTLYIECTNDSYNVLKDKYNSLSLTENRIIII